MQIPLSVFTAGLWLALMGVAAGALYLLVILIREWRSDSLW